MQGVCAPRDTKSCSLNSNPATIMTDPETASRTYVTPMSPESVEQIIAREKPDALLPTMGGQTALNLTKALAESGILAKYNVELIGAKLDAINKAEDRQLFKDAMDKIGLKHAQVWHGRDVGGGANHRGGDRHHAAHHPSCFHSRRFWGWYRV